MHFRTTGVLVVLASATAGAVDLSGRARGWVGGGIDTNATRDFFSPDGGATTDGVVQGIVNLGGAIDGERGQLAATYDIGARKFFIVPSEDTLVQSAQLDAALWIPGGFAVALAGRARDRRGADRDYSDLVAELTLEYLPDASLDFRLHGGIHRFIYWSGFYASYYAPEGGLYARYRFNKRHALVASGDVSFRTFNGVANQEDPGTPTPWPIRTDTVFAVSAAYTYRGPVNLTLSYGYYDSNSISFGESFRQHRIGLLFGITLPWSVTLIINGTLRLVSYPDGVYLGNPDLMNLEDDENQSTVGVKLVRPLGDHVDLDLRYALFYGRLPKNEFTYFRQVASLGLSVSF